MEISFLTLDDTDLKDKTVLVRVDINSPIEPESGKILDNTRIRKCSDTLKELAEGGAKTVVMAHQGRPGSEDFTTLEEHAKTMSQILNVHVDYVDDIFGETAREAISDLRSGEILLLENIRFYSEEVINKPPKEQAMTHLVRKLSPLVDLYVNDAFAAAHRSQPSLVGFGITLPSVAGRLMERELRGLKRGREPEHPCFYVLGGAKVDDSLLLTDHVLQRGIADYVLTGGLVAQAFLAGEGRELGGPSLEILSEEGYNGEIDRAKDMLSTHKEKIKLPKDLRIETEEGKAELLPVENLPSDMPVYDIGDKTLEEYSKLVRDAKTVIANGPLGVFEKKAFAEGTNGILEAMVESDAFTVIGGGHLVAAAKEGGFTDQLDHVSTGGGSLMSFLSGEKLPVVEVLENAPELRK